MSLECGVHDASTLESHLCFESTPHRVPASSEAGGYERGNWEGTSERIQGRRGWGSTVALCPGLLPFTVGLPLPLAGHGGNSHLPSHQLADNPRANTGGMTDSSGPLQASRHLQVGKANEAARVDPEMLRVRTLARAGTLGKDLHIPAPADSSRSTGSKSRGRLSGGQRGSRWWWWLGQVGQLSPVAWEESRGPGTLA